MTASPYPALLAHADARTQPLSTEHTLDDVTEGPALAHFEVLSEDDKAEVGVWEAQPGEFAGASAGSGEYMYILSGRVTVTSEDGSQLELREGVSFVAPDGWRGRWRVHETTRKVYVIWRTA
jgi:uncharacterized cupin superfamily protein